MSARVGSALLALALALAHGPLSSALAADADELFRQARELAFAGQREQAREICRGILRDSPGYHDVRILLGRLHAWDGDHETARRLFREVLEQRADYTDARVALVDVELWADRPEEALRQAELGLALDATNPELLLGRARALDRLGRGVDARDAWYRADAAGADPARSRHGLRRSLEEASRNKIGADYQYENFDDATESWHELAVDYRRRFGWGSLIGRVNLVRRFGEQGEQIEIDAYPRLGRRSYLFANLGLSDGDPFPERRYAAELYHNFPRSFEGSLGFRRLEFTSSDVTIYTATGARYVGRHWISLRPNYVEKEDGSSVSLGLTVRRYFLGRYEYAELALSGGTSNEDGLIVGQDDQLDSFRVRLELRRRVSHVVIVKGLAGYRSQELLADRTRGSFFVGIGVERLF